MSRPLVSVIMPVHNAQRFVAQAARSILSQSLRDLELITLDDGSTDATGGILESLARADERLRLQRSPTRTGVADTRNRGLELAQGRYVALMDADDVSLPDRFQLQVDYLENHPDVAVVGGWMEAIGAQDQPLGKIEKYPCQPAELARLMPKKNCLANPTVMFRPQLVRQVGGYRKLFIACSDYDLWLRMSEHWPLANLPRVLLHYRYNIESISTTAIGLNSISTVAARMSARLRREGKTDPLAQTKILDRNTLHALGIDDQWIGLGMGWAYLNRANRMVKHGGAAAAALFLREYRSQVSDDDVRRRLAAREAQIQARLARVEKRWPAYWSWLGRMCLRLPLSWWISLSQDYSRLRRGQPIPFL